MRVGRDRRASRGALSWTRVVQLASFLAKRGSTWHPPLLWSGGATRRDVTSRRPPEADGLCRNITGRCQREADGLCRNVTGRCRREVDGFRRNVTRRRPPKAAGWHMLAKQAVLAEPPDRRQRAAKRRSHRHHGCSPTFPTSNVVSVLHRARPTHSRAQDARPKPSHSCSNIWG